MWVYPVKIFFQKKILAEKPAISSVSYLFHEICGFMFSQIQIYSLFVLFFLTQLLIFFLSTPVKYTLNQLSLLPNLLKTVCFFCSNFRSLFLWQFIQENFCCCFFSVLMFWEQGYGLLSRENYPFISLLSIYLCTSRSLFEKSSPFLLCLFPFSYFNKLSVCACACMHTCILACMCLCRGLQGALHILLHHSSFSDSSSTPTPGSWLPCAPESLTDLPVSSLLEVGATGIYRNAQGVHGC